MQGGDVSNPINREIKAQILARIKNEGITAAQAAREHGISSKTIYGWLAKEAGGNPSLALVNRLKRENEGLYRLLGQLTAALDSLKKGR